MVGVDKFLSFWTTYNVRIIEVLIALIIMLAIYISFRILFGKSEAEVSASFDPKQLEKTLQKIIDSQKTQSTSVEVPTEAVPSAPLMEVSEGNAEAQAVAAKMTAEIEKVRTQLQEKVKEVESLKVQVVEAKKVSEAAGASGSSAAASGSGVSNDEKAELEAKIKDLEARLSEYEIIAEDIADLSMYKEENEKLKAEIVLLNAEIERLKAQGPSAGAAVVLDPALDIPSDVAALMEKPAPQEDETSSAPSEEPAAVESASAPAESAPAQAAADESLISDDLMAEFEAAVGEQKAAKPVTPAPAPEGDPKSDDLMGEFEKFVKKG